MGVLLNPHRFPLGGFTNAYRDEVLADSPLFYGRHNETSGTVMVDSSGNGRDGTYTGSPTLGVTGLVPSSSDKGVQFGTGQYGNLADAAWQDVARISLETIIKPSVVGSSVRQLLDRDGSGSNGALRAFQWRIETNGKIGVILFLNGSGTTFSYLTSTAGIVAGNVYHLGVSFDESTIKLFVNGSLDSSLAASGPLNSATRLIRVGFGLVGVQDETAIYGTALPDARWAAHAAAMAA